MNLRFRRAPDARHGLALAAGALMTLMVTSAPARAIEFEYGEIKGSLINTVSAGIQMRTASRDRRFLNANDGGDSTINMTPNVDDGQKHFGPGDIVGAPVKITTELNATWQNLGFYTRGTAFYDYIYDNNDLAKFGDPGSPTYGKITNAARSKASKGAEIQDMFVRGEFEIGTQPLNVRVGQQTLNWGEALFTQNEISIINPLDLQKFAVPGSELRDGLIPVRMGWISYEIQEGLAIEGFYQWEFSKLRLSPVGTYFGGADIIEESADGISGVSNGADCLAAKQAVPCARQLANKDPGDSGNYGVKLNIYAEALNNTEFGFYFVRYTSRFPSLGYVLNNDTNVPSGFFPGFYSRTEYARGVKMVAMSYNTTLDGPGVAVNGEFSYKMDEPGSIYGTTPYLQALCQAGAGASFCGNQSRSYFGYGGAGTKGEIQGFVPLDALHANVRFTKIFFAGNPVVAATGAESITVINENSLVYISNLPKTSEINLNPTITNGCGANVSFGAAPTCDVPSPTKVSSRANFLFLMSYPGAFGSPINLTPGLYYGMSIQGTSPLAAGSQSGFKSANISLKAEYQQNLTATLNFAKQWGGGWRNVQADRDFLGLTVNYAF